MMFAARRKFKQHGVIYSASSMGKALGVSRATIGRWETGGKPPLPHQLEDYCNVLIKNGLHEEAASSIFKVGYPTRTFKTSSIKPADSKSRPNRSIAVLVFENQSKNNSQLDIIAEGIAYDVITKLSEIRSLFVISSGTSFCYRDQSVSPQIAAREMNVQYLLTGTIRRSKQQLRISAHLIDTDSDRNIWAYTKDFDLKIDKIFKIQDQLTDLVVEAIEPQLLAEKGIPRKQSATTFSAWEAIAQSWEYIDRRTKSDLVAASAFARDAIKSEPKNALAHAVLAYVTMLRLHYGWESRETACMVGFENAKAAIKIDPLEPWAHVALGFVQLHAKSVSAAAASFTKALSINRNLAFAHTGYAAALCYLGRAKEALEQIDLADRLNPRNRSARGDLGTKLNVRATACFVLKRYAQGIDFAQCTVDENPELLGGYRNLVVNYALSGMRKEAKVALKMLKDRHRTISLKWIADWLPYVRADEKKRYLHAFKLAGLR